MHIATAYTLEMESILEPLKAMKKNEGKNVLKWRSNVKFLKINYKKGCSVNATSEDGKTRRNGRRRTST